MNKRRTKKRLLRFADELNKLARVMNGSSLDGLKSALKALREDLGSIRRGHNWTKQCEM